MIFRFVKQKIAERWSVDGLRVSALQRIQIIFTSEFGD
jgi:hypothetical protein